MIKVKRSNEILNLYRISAGDECNNKNAVFTRVSAIQRFHIVKGF